MKIGNRVTEKDIREQLDQVGFLGRSAVFEELELHAIVRPGWVQLFRFTVRLRKENAESSSIKYGTALCDERAGKTGKTQVELFEDIESRESQLALVARDMIVCQRGQSAGAGWLLLLIALVLSLMALANWLIG